MRAPLLAFRYHNICAESGAGYTLSGKLLDPQSAAAKAYGFRKGMLQGEGSTSLLLDVLGIEAVVILAAPLTMRA